MDRIKGGGDCGPGQKAGPLQPDITRSDAAADFVPGPGKGAEPVHLVLLHTNDIHGDFFGGQKDGVFTGGLSLLSGMLRRIRQKEKNVLYAVAGDMFMGSIIDQEYRGLSTIRMTNALEPDVFCLGNHEVDYGLAHLLFLEKCADFPIVCANMYIRELNRRVFLPYVDLVREGVTVRFIGLLTDSIGEKLLQEKQVDSAVRIRDPLQDIGQLIEKERPAPADITVLLTHIGIEEDKKLAERIAPEWGVNLIIGGHSHTFMEEPLTVNGYPIAQAGCGSGQLGRFDLYVDPVKKRLTDWRWELLPVNEATSEADPLIDFYTDRFQDEVDKKYDQVLMTFPCEYTHPWFHRETQLLDLFADLYQKTFQTDLFLLSSNVIRAKKLGPVVTRKDFIIAFPYENEVYQLTVNGRRLEEIIQHTLRKNAWEGTSIYFLFSENLRVEITREEKIVQKTEIYGGPVEPERMYTLGITGYAYKNPVLFLGIEPGELGQDIEVKKLSENDRQSFWEYLALHGNIELKNEGRLRLIG